MTRRRPRSATTRSTAICRARRGLIVVPVSALQYWGGCTEDGVIIGHSDQRDDYERACGSRV